ncbi:hypothetical protein [uncultured Ilyobacter sp.]|uniref:hypothetical protein n=1 Tax=uncultured Ilyobacter sp. TaxID=544433 RepID=UPI0029F4AC79|nr:hypothetical protein [uncultured Ilyobacter sp.]
MIKLMIAKQFMNVMKRTPYAPKNKEFRHFEVGTIIGKKRETAIVTLVEKSSKYIVLLKASRKIQDVLNAMNNWFNSISNLGIKKEGDPSRKTTCGSLSLILKLYSRITKNQLQKWLKKYLNYIINCNKKIFSILLMVLLTLVGKRPFQISGEIL